MSLWFAPESHPEARRWEGGWVEVSYTTTQTQKVQQGHVEKKEGLELVHQPSLSCVLELMP